MSASPENYEAVISQITQHLAQANLEVARTFDLKSACADHLNGVCPHHGTAPCDCQMTILLVYSTNRVPVTLTIRQCDGQIQFALEYPPQQPPDPQLEATILQALVVDLVHTAR